MSRVQPLLSIICPTYNQGKFIAQTLESFIMQKTEYPFEIIVHDDASTDDTAAIVRQYEEKYPELFANIYQTENQFSKGILNVTFITFAAAKGKYLALCEGDDYWIDPLKIQKQVSFLEAHPDYTISFHEVYQLQPGKEPELFPMGTQPATYTLEDLAERGNFIHTVSTIFRHSFREFPEWFSKSPVGDYPLHMLNASRGKVYYMPDAMAVYRRSIGIYGTLSALKQNYDWYRTLGLLLGHFHEEKIHGLLRKNQARSLLYMYNNGGEDQLKELDPRLKDVLDLVTIRTADQLSTFPVRLLSNGLRRKLILNLRHKISGWVRKR